MTGSDLAAHVGRRLLIGLVIAMIGGVALFEGGRYVLHHLDVYVFWK
jgi:hypothetical protein